MTAMQNRGELGALAERCEAATGPLAAEIALKLIGDAWKLLNPMPTPWRVPAQANGEPWGGDGLGPYTPEATAWEAKHKSFKRLIDAGASLDAAMSLVPVALYSQRLNIGGGLNGALVTLFERHGVVLAQSADCATLPLALTAAALRAIASQQTHREEL